MDKIELKTKNYQLKTDGGFTLIETIIYSALLSIVIGMVLLAVFQIIDSQDRARSRTEVEEEANFLFAKIKWALTGFQTINQPAVNSTSSLLSVNKYNFSQNPLVFDLASGALRLRRGSGATTTINSENITINSLIFSHLAASGTAPAAMKVKMAASFNPIGALRIYPVSTTLETTIYLRK